MAVKEWRVVSIDRKGLFKTFDENETAARYFITPREMDVRIKDGDEFKVIKVVKKPGQLFGDENGEYRLESRPSGTQGNDSTWKAEAI